MSELSYAEVSAILYRSSDIGVRLTKEQQSFIVQAVALFNSPALWSDYETYYDAIAALVSDSEYKLLIEEAYPLQKVQVDCFAVNGSASGGVLTYNANANLPFAYAMSTDNVSGRAILHGVWLENGIYQYSGWSSLTTNGGNTDLRIETVTGTLVQAIATAIRQSGAFGTRVNTTGSFTITAPGLYIIAARNNGTGIGAQRQVNWTSHHIVQSS